MKILRMLAAFMLLAGPAYAQLLPMHINAPTVSISVTSSTGRVAYGALNSPGIIITDSGAADIFCKSGDSTITAAVTDTIIKTGTVQSFTKSPVDTHIACITASGTATAYIQTGTGD
jgi:hypothetical protein